MKEFRPYTRSREEFEKQLATKIADENRNAIGYLLPPQSYHSYEHGLKVDFQDFEQKPRTAEMQPIEAEGTIKFDSLRSGEFEHFSEFFRNLIEQFSSAMAKSIFSTIEQASEETGYAGHNRGSIM